VEGLTLVQGDTSILSRGGEQLEMSPVPAVTTHGLTKSFQLDSGPVLALDNVDITINKGEFVSFVGRSGCGKSTLLNMIAGLLEPTAGRIFVNGQPVLEPSRSVGFMFQAPVLLPWRTVEANVLMPAEVFGSNDTEMRDKARSVLDMVGLGDFMQAYPRQLSGGMQQRVALARVLTYEPQLLLMDEPFGALDEFTREAMNLELLRIADAAGITVVFVTHNISEAVFMSDRVVVMTARPGKVSGIVDIPLPRPREIAVMQDRAFTDLIFDIRNILGHNHDHR
jgi:NitT/TauT family transport system ATP-binding protein